MRSWLKCANVVAVYPIVWEIAAWQKTLTKVGQCQKVGQYRIKVTNSIVMIGVHERQNNGCKYRGCMPYSMVDRSLTKNFDLSRSRSKSKSMPHEDHTLLVIINLHKELINLCKFGDCMSYSMGDRSLTKNFNQCRSRSKSMSRSHEGHKFHCHDWCTWEAE